MSDRTIRCARCGGLVYLKPKAKPRKMCGTCRKAQQANFKNKVKQAKQDRAKNIPVEAIEQEN